MNQESLVAIRGVPALSSVVRLDSQARPLNRQNVANCSTSVGTVWKGIPVKRWMEKLPWKAPNNLVDQLVGRIAARSRSAVWQRVVSRCQEMGPNEARGYIRARAAKIVQREFVIATSQTPGLSNYTLSQIAGLAMDEVVRSMLSEAKRMHLEPVAVPVRRAA